MAADVCKRGDAAVEVVNPAEVFCEEAVFESIVLSLSTRRANSEIKLQAGLRAKKSGLCLCLRLPSTLASLASGNANISLYRCGGSDGIYRQTVLPYHTSRLSQHKCRAPTVKAVILMRSLLNNN